MAYTIQYSGASALSHRRKMRIFVPGLIILLLLFALLTQQTHLLLPGDPAVTAAALQVLASEVGDGEHIANALVQFMKAVVDGANPH